VGIVSSQLSTPWYKSQIKILPNKLHGKELNSTLKLYKTILGINVKEPKTDLFTLIQAYLKSDFFIRTFILNELPEWEIIFYKNRVDEVTTNLRLEKVIDNFQNRYITIYQIPKNGMIIIQIDLTNKSTLCQELALRLIKQLDRKLSMVYRDKLNEELSYLQESINNLDQMIAEKEGEYIEFVNSNKFNKTPLFDLVTLGFKEELRMYNNLRVDLKQRFIISELERNNNQARFQILELDINPMIKHYPYRNFIYSTTLITVLSGILLISFRKEVRILSRKTI